MNDTVLINSLQNAVEQLYEKDAYLLQSDHELHEQTVSHRLAVYLENNLRKSSIFRKNDFSVDCEYNKNGTEPKKIYSCCYNCDVKCFIKSLREAAFEAMFDVEKSVRPDIIVHKRGMNYPNNLLLVELKKKSNSQNAEKEKDKMKVSAFTCSEHKDEKPHYQYQLGFFMEYSDKKTALQEFKNGKETTVYSFDAETKEWTD